MTDTDPRHEQLLALFLELDSAERTDLESFDAVTTAMCGLVDAVRAYFDGHPDLPPLDGQ